jgi:hypothetical protein
MGGRKVDYRGQEGLGVDARCYFAQAVYGTFTLEEVDSLLPKKSSVIVIAVLESGQE